MPTLSWLPPSLMSAAVLNVTAVGATGPGHLTVYPAGTALPGTSTVNFATPSAVPNRAVTRLSSGRFTVTNGGSKSHVVIDVVGWYAAPGVAGGASYQPVLPTPVLNTEVGLGVRQGAI